MDCCFVCQDVCNVVSPPSSLLPPPSSSSALDKSEKILRILFYPQNVRILSVCQCVRVSVCVR